MLSRHLRTTQMSQVKGSPVFIFQTPDGKTYTNKKYRAVLDSVRRDILPESKITVRYSRGIENSGTFSDYKTAAAFLRECTEPALLKFIKEGKW